jgi:hypothetical protein
MLKNRKCKDCGISFIPNAQFEPRCFKCKTIKFNEQKAKYCKNQQKDLVNRSQKPQKPLKPKIDEEQAIINKIVRERDAGKPCISCGVIGKTLEAGHFISKNKCKTLRYDKRNIHGQCLNCNRILHGNYAEYRLGLISRFSIEYVEILEEIERNERKIIEKFT